MDSSPRSTPRLRKMDYDTSTFNVFFYLTSWVLTSASWIYAAYGFNRWRALFYPRWQWLYWLVIATGLQGGIGAITCVVAIWYEAHGIHVGFQSIGTLGYARMIIGLLFTICISTTVNLTAYRAQLVTPKVFQQMVTQFDELRRTTNG